MSMKEKELIANDKKAAFVQLAKGVEERRDMLGEVFGRDYQQANSYQM